MSTKLAGIKVREKSLHFQKYKNKKIIYPINKFYFFNNLIQTF